MPRSLSIGLIVGLIITALSTSIARAESRHCYWNAKGLPYSMNPPPSSEPADEHLTPAQMTFALYINSPGLPFKHACGVITDADLVKAREMYRYWDCSAESSVGQMVEGLYDGGPLVWSGMFAFEDFYAKNPDVLPIMCPHVAGVDRVCFLTPPSGDDELEARNRKKFPQCVAYYDWFLKVRPQLERLGYKESAYDEGLWVHKRTYTAWLS